MSDSVRVYVLWGSRPDPKSSKTVTLYKRRGGEPMTRPECQRDAKKHGCVAKFVEG